MLLLHPKEVPPCLTGTVSKFCWRPSPRHMRLQWLTITFSSTPAVFFGRPNEMLMTWKCSPKLPWSNRDPGEREPNRVLSRLGEGGTGCTFKLEPATYI
jgi:hypothetical protein